MALILAIETGTDICSVALVRDGELVALRESDEERNHAKKIAVFVDFAGGKASGESTGNSVTHDCVLLYKNILFNHMCDCENTVIIVTVHN